VCQAAQVELLGGSHAKQPLAFLDIESTGCNLVWDRITEVALIKVGTDGTSARWETLLNPAISIPSQITALTGINNSMVEDASSFESIAEELSEIPEGPILVAHAVRFDYGFLMQVFKRVGRFFTLRSFFTVKLSRALYPQYRKHNLQVICIRHGIDRGRAHRSMDDAQSIHHSA